MDVESHLQTVLKQARLVMEYHHEDIGKLYFGSFPKGACGNTCQCLGRYLGELGFEGIQYVSGERCGISHAWLEFEGHIIDITSDQFADGLGSIFWGRHSCFHDSFLNQDHSDLHLPSCLYFSYKKFKKYMEECEFD